ncbi:dehydrogenase/reductase SDR family member 7C isoform X2 [Lutra lutra]|uniref:dehydrogenase/reductase SDR family member 7C isoform X2 n=1 Tax=Lutra lutra TaxID=9657 RepID=UPI001FD39D0B|nr:dehydrogenase/reductase SDR family member 7C isoform X2 [Lutra lutra]
MGVTAVLMLPLLLLGISGLLFIYQEVSRLWSKSAVQNKVVVITDAISGLGKECARVFHTGGARLVLCGKNWERLEILYDALISVADPSKTFTPKLVLLDLSDISCVQDVAKEVLDCYGCVDILINNASMKIKGPAHKISLELDKKIMDANYFGPITLTKALLPDMISRRTGQIVLVNNIQGKLGIPFRTAYAASKHAALGFFDCLRAEVEEYDVVVSTVSPTFIRSYRVDPGQGNWEASIWKCELSEGICSLFQEADLWGAPCGRCRGGDAYRETEETGGLHGQPHPQGRRVPPHLLPRVIFRRGGLWGEGETQCPRGELTAGGQMGHLTGNKVFPGKVLVPCPFHTGAQHKPTTHP